MNDWLKKLLQDLNSGVDDNQILKKYKELNGDLKVLKQLKVARSLASEGGYSPQEALEMTVGAEFIQKHFKQAAPPPVEKKVEQPQQQLQQQPSQQQPQMQQEPAKVVDSDDPIGDMVRAQAMQRTPMKNTTDATFAPKALMREVEKPAVEVAQKPTATNGQSQYGVFHDYEEAKAHLEKKIASGKLKVARKPVNGAMVQQDNNLDNIPMADLEASLDPNNLTDRIALNRYKDAKSIGDALKTSRTFEEAVLKREVQTNSLLSRQATKLVQEGTAEKNLSPEMRGNLMWQFINDPTVNKYAERDVNFAGKLQGERLQFYKKYPEAATPIVANMIAQAREDKGYNNAFANIHTKEETDEIVSKMDLSDDQKEIYQKYIRPKLSTVRTFGRTLGNWIPGVAAFVNDEPIASTGFLENFTKSVADTYSGLGRSIASMNVIPGTKSSIRDLYSSRADQLAADVDTDLRATGVTPKGMASFIGYHGGTVTGQVWGMGLTASWARGALGLAKAPMAANTIGVALSTYGNYVKQASTQMPDEPQWKQDIYSLGMTGLEVFTGNLFPEIKVVDAISDATRSTVARTITQMTDGKITTYAASRIIGERYARDLIKFGVKTVEGNAKESVEELATTLGDHWLKSAVTGQDIDTEQLGKDMYDTFVTTMVGSSFVSGIAAHYDVKQGSMNRAAIYDVATNSNRYVKAIEKQAMTDDDLAATKDERIANVKAAAKIADDLRGYDISDMQSGEYILHGLNQRILEKKLETATTEGAKRKINEQIAFSKKVQDEILNGKNELQVVSEQAQKDFEKEDAKWKERIDAVAYRDDLAPEQKEQEKERLLKQHSAWMTEQRQLGVTGEQLASSEVQPGSNVFIPFELKTELGGEYQTMYDSKIKELQETGMTEQEAHDEAVKQTSEELRVNMNADLEELGYKGKILSVSPSVGGYTSDAGEHGQSPNILVQLEEGTSDEEVHEIMNALNLGADQEGANAFRNPTKEELDNDSENVHGMLLFDKPDNMSEGDFKKMMAEVNNITDTAGNKFLAGNTRFGNKVGVGGHFYKGGDFVEEVGKRFDDIKKVLATFGVSPDTVNLKKVGVLKYEAATAEKIEQGREGSSIQQDQQSGKPQSTERGRRLVQKTRNRIAAGIEKAKAKPKQVERKTGTYTAKDSSKLEEAAKAEPRPSIAKVYKDVARVFNAFKEIMPDLSITIHHSQESYEKAITAEGGNVFDSGGVYYKKDGKRNIHINLSQAKSEDVLHEAAHPLLDILTKENPEVLKAMHADIVKLAAEVPSVQAAIDHGEEYAEYGEARVHEETITQFLALVADGTIDVTKQPPSVLEKIKNILENLLRSLGYGDKVEATPESIIDIARKYSDAIQVGKQLDYPASYVDAEGNSTYPKYKINAQVKNITSGYVYRYIKDSAIMDALKKPDAEGKVYVTEDRVLAHFADDHVVLHMPDHAATGELYKDDKKIVDGKGGVFYVIKYHNDGHFWAATDGKSARGLAKVLNDARTASLAAGRDGKIKMVLVSSPPEKVLTSTLGATSMIEMLTAAAVDEQLHLKPEQVSRAIAAAVRNLRRDVTSGEATNMSMLEHFDGETLPPRIPATATIDEVKEILFDWYKPANTNFNQRKWMGKYIATEIVNAVTNEGSQKQLHQFLSELGGQDLKGKKISATNLIEGLSNVLNEPMLRGMPTNQAYAVIEIDDEVEAKEMIGEGHHPSYQWVVKSKNGKKVSLHMLQDRLNWKDHTIDPKTGELVKEEDEKKLFPTTRGVTVSPVTLKFSKSQKKSLPSPDAGKQEQEGRPATATSAATAPVQTGTSTGGAGQTRGRNRSYFALPESTKAELQKSVTDYTDKHRDRFNIPADVETDVVLDEPFHKSISDEYDKLPDDDSKNPVVAEAYSKMADEVEVQYDYLTKELGIKVEFSNDDPYPNSEAMTDDVVNNKHLFAYKGGEDHPFLGQRTLDKNGVTANEKFRAVHDYFGHAVEGNQFGKHGEERAWVAHSKMFSPQAQRALSTETRGQNAWVNSSGTNTVALKKINDGGKLIKEGKTEEGEALRKEGQAEFQFAKQKVAVLPEKFTDWTDHAPTLKYSKSKKKSTPISLKELGVKKGDTADSFIDKLIAHGGKYTDLLKMIKADPNFKNIELDAYADLEAVGGVGLGLYFPVGHEKAGTMQISGKGDAYETGVHEFAHFLTLDSAAAEKAKGTDSYKALEEMYKYISSKKGKPSAFHTTPLTTGLLDVREFMAELIVNEDFRDYVDDVFAANFDEIVKTNKAIARTQVKSMGEMMGNLIRDILNIIRGNKKLDVQFDSSKSVIDNAAKLASDLFYTKTESESTGLKYSKSKNKGDERRTSVFSGKSFDDSYSSRTGRKGSPPPLQLPNGKLVDELDYKKNSDGTYKITGSYKDEPSFNYDSLTEDQLKEHLGDRIAQKIKDEKGDPMSYEHLDFGKTLAGTDLKYSKSPTQKEAEKIADDLQHEYGNKLPSLLHSVDDTILFDSMSPDTKQDVINRIQRISDGLKVDEHGVINVPAIQKAVNKLLADPSAENIQEAKRVIRNQIKEITDTPKLTEKVTTTKEDIKQVTDTRVKDEVVMNEIKAIKKQMKDWAKGRRTGFTEGKTEMKAKQEVEKQKLRDRHEKELARVDAKNTKGIEKIKARHDRELNELDAQHTKQILKEKFKLSAAKEKFAEEKQEGRDEATALADIKQGIRDRVNALLKDAVKRKVFTGEVSGRMFASVMKKLNNANTPYQMITFADYMEKVLSDVEYIKDMQDAKAVKAQIRNAIKDKGGVKSAKMKAVIKEFLGINPDSVTDLKEYVDKAQKILNVARGVRVASNIFGAKVKGDTVDISLAEIEKYTEDQGKEAVRLATERMKEEYRDLVDAGILDPALMSLEEMQEVVDAINGDNKTTVERLAERMAADENKMKALRTVAEYARIGLEDYNNNNTTNNIQKTKEEQKIVDDLLDIDIDKLTGIQLTKLIDVMNNIVVNDNFVGSGEIAVTARVQQNVRQFENYLKQHNVNFGDLSGLVLGVAKGFASTQLLFEFVTKSAKAAAEFQRLSGVMDIFNGHAKAKNIQAVTLKAYDKMKSKMKGIDSALNRYRRGVYADVLNNFGGTPEEVKAEFDRRKVWIQHTATKLKDSRKKREKLEGALVQQVYDELLANSENAADVMAAMKAIEPNNVKLVQFWQDSFKAREALTAENAELYNNQIFESVQNYTATSLKGVNGAKGVLVSRDRDMFEEAFMSKNINNAPSGTKTKKTRSAKPPPNNVLNLDFDAVQSKKYFETNYDVETSAAIASVKQFMVTPEAADLFGSIENRDIILESIKKSVQLQKGRVPIVDEQGKALSKALNILTAKGVRVALGSIFQLFTQYPSIALNTIVNLGSNAGLYGRAFLVSNDIKLFDQFAIGLRGEQQAGYIKKVDTGEIDRAVLGNNTVKTWQAAMKVGEKLHTAQMATLVKSDVSVARTSWLAFYMESLRDQGVDIRTINWENEHLDPNLEAAAYAEQMVSRNQNPNDPSALGSMFQDSGNAWKTIGKNIMLPFSSFAVNMRLRMTADMQKIMTWENPKEAALSLAATTAEMLTFNAVKVYFLGQMTTIGAAALAKLLGYAPDDDDEEKDSKKDIITIKLKNGKEIKVDKTLKKYVSNVFSDFFMAGFGTLPQQKFNQAMNAGYRLIATEQYASGWTNEFPDLFYQPSEVEGSWWDDKGLYSIAPKKVIDIWKNGDLALTGTIDKIPKGRAVEHPKYVEAELTKEEQQMHMLIFAIDAIGLAGLGDAQLNVINSKLKLMAKKHNEFKYGGKPRKVYDAAKGDKKAVVEN